MRLGTAIEKLIWKIQKRRFCKLNGYFCPDCIYHEFIFDGCIFRGTKCHYPIPRQKKEKSDEQIHRR